MKNTRRAKMRQLKQTGKTYAEISRIYGVSRQRVQQLVLGDDKKIKPGGVCDNCGKKVSRIDVHHTSYYPESATKNLCTSCHRNMHKKEKAMLIRPEIYNRAVFAIRRLAQDRSNQVHTVTPTELINSLLLEEWARKYPGMMFPDESGAIMPLPRTPSQVIP